MSSFPPPPPSFSSPPPPPTPWDESTPPAAPKRQTVDPTPVLSAIGQVAPAAWADPISHIVRLQGATISWIVQWYLTLGIAAAMPWVMGKPGVLWSALFLSVQFGSRYLGRRFAEKRGRQPGVAASKRNITELVVRSTLSVVILTAWFIGSGLAFDGGIGWVIWGALLGGGTVANSLRYARQIGQANARDNAARRDGV